LGLIISVFQPTQESAKQAQKSGIEGSAGDGPKQPAQVVAHGAEHRMQGIARFALQPTAVETMVGLEVADDGFNGLTSPKEPLNNSLR
jgi:hypothetical protein